MVKVGLSLWLDGPNNTPQHWVCRWGQLIPCDTGYVLPIICLTVTVLQGQWTWWRYLLCWVPFYFFSLNETGEEIITNYCCPPEFAWIVSSNTGWSRKTAQTLMRYNFSTAGHRVTQFPVKCSETNW